ncbi:MAG: hypothetical protein LUG94_03345, partial [Ruminococcus sp.]|nr:hypothetical protein [Ruminococcus sp.]
LMNRFNIKKVSLITSLILVSSIFVGCNSEYDESDGGDTTTTAAVVATTTTIAKVEGDSVSNELGTQTVNEGIGITVKNIYKMDLESDDGYINLAFYVEIVNQSEESNEYSAAANFGVREQGSTEDNEDLMGLSNSYLYIKRNTDFNRLSGVIAPNTMLDGIVTVRVPSDFQEATFVFYPNITTSTGEITLTFTPDDLEDLPINS